MRGDGRSCRVAVVPDTVLNPPPGAPDRLTELADAGWGVMALGPPGAGELWLDAIVDQVVTFLGDDYEVILDGPETRRSSGSSRPWRPPVTPSPAAHNSARHRYALVPARSARA